MCIRDRTPIGKSKFDIGGAATSVRGDGGGGVKRVNDKRKRRVNTETKRTAHLKVARVNAVRPMLSVEGYDHLDPMGDQNNQVGIPEGYDHLPPEINVELV